MVCILIKLALRVQVRYTRQSAPAHALRLALHRRGDGFTPGSAITTRRNGDTSTSSTSRRVRRCPSNHDPVGCADSRRQDDTFCGACSHHCNPNHAARYDRQQQETGKGPVLNPAGVSLYAPAQPPPVDNLQMLRTLEIRPHKKRVRRGKKKKRDHNKDKSTTREVPSGPNIYTIRKDVAYVPRRDGGAPLMVSANTKSRQHEKEKKSDKLQESGQLVRTTGGITFRPLVRRKPRPDTVERKKEPRILKIMLSSLTCITTPTAFPPVFMFVVILREAALCRFLTLQFVSRCASPRS
ncbi:hypothetical protein KVT40_006406 [Elsinoe batatas]|uniref:Uncharacterized protein n=1 Tax=Elsinoe batatas TaxID=2601811 RepID=A0A8K0L210_9PEZI|nr:hypothetical protein KVT40_006406 [Elsinoe batatas]